MTGDVSCETCETAVGGAFPWTMNIDEIQLLIEDSSIFSSAVDRNGSRLEGYEETSVSSDTSAFDRQMQSLLDRDPSDINDVGRNPQQGGFDLSHEARPSLIDNPHGHGHQSLSKVTLNDCYRGECQTTTPFLVTGPSPIRKDMQSTIVTGLQTGRSQPHNPVDDSQLDADHETFESQILSPLREDPPLESASSTPEFSDTRSDVETIPSPLNAPTLTSWSPLKLFAPYLHEEDPNLTLDDAKENLSSHAKMPQQRKQASVCRNIFAPVEEAVPLPSADDFSTCDTLFRISGPSSNNNHREFDYEIPKEERWADIDNQKCQRSKDAAALWYARFDDLIDYYRQHGTFNVPQSVPKLGPWVNKVRQAKKKAAGDGWQPFLNERRIHHLDAIGFNWGKTRRRSNDQWMDRFKQLLQYKRENGHTRVPSKGSALGRWTAKQRSQYKQRQQGKANTLADDQIAALNGIEFEWVATTYPIAFVGRHTTGQPQRGRTGGNHGQPVQYQPLIHDTNECWDQVCAQAQHEQADLGSVQLWEV